MAVAYHNNRQGTTNRKSTCQRQAVNADQHAEGIGRKVRSREMKHRLFHWYGKTAMNDTSMIDDVS